MIIASAMPRSLRSASPRGSRPRTRHNHRRDNCCPGARRARAAGSSPSIISSPCRSARRRGPGSSVGGARSPFGTSVPGLAEGGAAPPAMPLMRVDADHVAAALGAPSGPGDFSQPSRISDGLAGSPKLIQHIMQPVLSGATAGGKPHARQVRDRADRPADDISGDDAGPGERRGDRPSSRSKMERALAVIRRG